MREPIRNMGASIRARLQNLARERGQPFQLLLAACVAEYDFMPGTREERPERPSHQP